MPLEATVVCIDNSEYGRNGDYAPSRFQAQQDAINLLAGAKTQHHPENTVGVMSMAGAAPTVMVTPTSDLGKVLQAMQRVPIDGASARLGTSIQIAQLTLKHRENKNQRQRIVVFIGSPIQEDVGALVKLGKRWVLVLVLVLVPRRPCGRRAFCAFCAQTLTGATRFVHSLVRLFVRLFVCSLVCQVEEE